MCSDARARLARLLPPFRALRRAVWFCWTRGALKYLARLVRTPLSPLHSNGIARGCRDLNVSILAVSLYIGILGSTLTSAAWLILDIRCVYSRQGIPSPQTLRALLPVSARRCVARAYALLLLRAGPALRARARAAALARAPARALACAYVLRGRAARGARLHAASVARSSACQPSHRINCCP